MVKGWDNENKIKNKHTKIYSQITLTLVINLEDGFSNN